MTISEKETRLLNDFKKRVLAAFPDRVKEITLFGSRATGRAGKHSDYDVFVRVDQHDKKLADAIFDISYDIYVESRFSMDISPVIMSNEYFKSRLSQERRIARDIVEQGIAL